MAVVGVMRRPREGDRYERLRRQTNAKLQEEVLKLKVDWLKNKKGNVSFIDLDAILREGMDFTADGVHLHETGNEKICRRLREWMRPLYAWALPEQRKGMYQTNGQKTPNRQGQV